MTCCSRASRKTVLPVPAGPQTTRFSRRPTHSRVCSACWVGNGIDDAVGSQASKVLPGREAGGIAAGGQHGAGPAGGFLGQQRFDDFGGISQRWARAVASTSAATARACGNRNARINDSTSAGNCAADSAEV